MANNEETSSVYQRVDKALTLDGDGKPLAIDKTAVLTCALMSSLIEVLLTKQILTSAELDILLSRLGRNQVFPAVEKSESKEVEMGDLPMNQSKRKPELPPSREHAF